MKAKAPAPRACSDKRRYPDEAQALQFAIGRPGRKSTDAPMRAYPCRGCSGWHLTSKPLDPAPVKVQACRPGDRAVLQTSAGKQLLTAAVKAITAPRSAKRKTRTIPTSKARGLKVAGKRPGSGQSKRRRATVL